MHYTIVLVFHVVDITSYRDIICEGMENCVHDNKTIVETDKIDWINSGNVACGIEYLGYYPNK